MADTRKLVILGSGSAGLTAAIYAARAQLQPIVISGSQRGGQLTLTTDVENFPGFPEGIQGPELMEIMRKQAERFDTDFIEEDATAVDFRTRPFEVTAAQKTLRAESVIIATGAGTNWLGLPNEQRLIGHGISSCAPCDAFFFRGKEVAVVGGGDSAMEEALVLTKFATKVTIIHRRDRFRASKIMAERALRHGKIEVLWNTVVVDVLGNGSVSGLRLRDVGTGREWPFRVDGLFVAIGHHPNTELFRGQVELDDQGYVVVREGTRTSVEGVFAAGDVHDHRYRQAVTAAAFGCMAAMDVERYLEGHSTH
ncbi:MAG: thioredoxin-disulfide reductase [Bacillati bacterium ANGP1]|uniref:Thioredoxin reductase n=1 Tax=Candidatus Segetimicrobium genomatis TaxID=2569760 RepID=A0A537JSN0_9BACT|nr:MAG: thioredoxin-disulfide reductase [Terrabacteria group bacterium ANGP1]